MAERAMVGPGGAIAGPGEPRMQTSSPTRKAAPASLQPKELNFLLPSLTTSWSCSWGCFSLTLLSLDPWCRSDEKEETTPPFCSRWIERIQENLPAVPFTAKPRGHPLQAQLAPGAHMNLLHSRFSSSPASGVNLRQVPSPWQMAAPAYNLFG